jgi:hypothetical protein
VFLATAARLPFFGAVDPLGAAAAQSDEGASQHPGVLHVVDNEDGLNLLSQQYSIHRGNLLQLVGLQQAPRDNRTICGDDWMRLQDVKWLRSDATGEAAPVIGTFTRFLRDVASLRSNMPIKSAGQAVEWQLNGKYKSNGQPVLTIRKRTTGAPCSSPPTKRGRS